MRMLAVELTAAGETAISQLSSIPVAAGRSAQVASRMCGDYRRVARELQYLPRTSGTAIRRRGGVRKEGER
jgi:hypothetical protein